MRPFLLVAAVAVLLVVPAPASAQTPPDCQTPNGARSLSRMAGELLAVGYGGPWDPGSVISAYARTTGGAVMCEGQPTAAPAVVGDTIVVLVGGLDSSIDDAKWTLLQSDVEAAAAGFVNANFWRFSYAAPASDPAAAVPYGHADTCRSMGQSEARLASMIRTIRDRQLASQVLVVGHSLGGVLAADTVIDNADLVPFVRKVVAIDSPFGGINSLADVWFGADCAASNELRARRPLAPVRQGVYAAALGPLMQRGLSVGVLVNPQDGAVGPDYQCLCKLAVNWYYDSVDTANLSHSAAFFDPPSMAQIAQFLAG